MIIGIGTDIEEIERFRNYTNREYTLLNRIFTPEELDYCFKDKTVAQHLAGKYCAKEACVKALKESKLIITKIEILNEENGAPYVKIDGLDENIKVMVSISHTSTYATATAIAYTVD